MKHLLLCIAISFASVANAETYSCIKADSTRHEAIVTNFNNNEEWALTLNGQSVNSWTLLDCKTEDGIRTCALTVFQEPITRYSCTQTSVDSCVREGGYCGEGSQCCGTLTCWSSQCL